MRSSSVGAVSSLLVLVLSPLLRAALSIDTTLIGNPGNPADTTVMVTDGTTGYGSVPYSYRIGTYDVTNSQYSGFLNSKATIGDPLALYNTNMGGISTSSGNVGGITRTGNGTAVDPYQYAAISGRANQPVCFVSWYDAVRFINWLDNGQGNGDTETGSYTLLGGTPTPSNGLTVTRTPGATWFLPSENEWYKAAYYNPSTGLYSRYGTGSNTAPYSAAPPGTIAPTPSQTANYFNDDNAASGVDNGYAITGSPIFDPTQDYLTDVGAYSQAMSAYGVFDMAGDVYNWNEALVTSEARGLRGGSWNQNSDGMASYNRYGYDPTYEEKYGFRVAGLVSVPEPTGLALLFIGAVILLVRPQQAAAPTFT